LMPLTSEMLNSNIMVNHIGTWKYRFRMVSCRINLAGTGMRKPPMMAYKRKMMAAVGTTILKNLFKGVLINHAKGTERA
jgi:hypothetical protein